MPQDYANRCTCPECRVRHASPATVIRDAVAVILTGAALLATLIAPYFITIT